MRLHPLGGFLYSAPHVRHTIASLNRDVDVSGAEKGTGMVRLSINEMTTYRWSFEEDVHRCHEMGIPSIAVWRQKLSDFGEEKGIELLSETGLAVSSLLWAGGFTGSDGRSYRESVADAREAIRLAAVMKADCLIVYSGSRGGHTLNHARRLLKNALSDLLPIACEFGVTLAVEPIPAECAGGWTFLCSLEETLALLRELESPQVQLAFDTCHFGYNETILERLPALASRIAIVQLGDTRHPPCGDPQRCRLGEGNVPLGTILSQLARGGYDGYFDIKLMGEEIENCDYCDLICHSKRAFESLVAAVET